MELLDIGNIIIYNMLALMNVHFLNNKTLICTHTATVGDIWRGQLYFFLKKKPAFL